MKSRRLQRVAVVGVFTTLTGFFVVLAWTQSRPGITSRPPSEEVSEESRQITIWMNEVRSNDKEVREKAIDNLGKSGPAGEVAIPILIEALATDLGYASSALSMFGEHAIPQLTKALSHPSKEIRKGAALSLGKMGAKARPAIPSLVSLFGDPDRSVLLMVCAALRYIGDDAAVPSLVEAAEADCNKSVRGAALITAAYLVKSKPAKIRLTSTILSLAKQRRLFADDAASALGVIGEPALPALISVFASPESDWLENVARAALFQVDDFDSESIERLVNLLRDGPEEQRGHVVRLLSEKGISFEPAIQAVERSLADESAMVRIEAALGCYYLTAAVHPGLDVIVKELRSGNAEIRTFACMAIGRLKEDAADAVKALQLMLRDEDEDVCGLAIFALGEIGPKAKGAISDLVKIADENEGLRDAANQALRAIREDEK